MSMKQRSNSRKFHHRWKRKFSTLILLVFCFLIFALMESQCSRIKMLKLIKPSMQKPKIAFLFLARNRIPLDMVWDEFFRGDAENSFSIYVHSRPGFVLNTKTTRSTFFLNRQINDSIQVDWGEASMIEAERILLRHALMDPSNTRFLFLSDSCIPLYNFSYTYDYIMSASTSFVDSFADTKEGRYNPKMHPVVPVDTWRKGSQKRSLPEFWRESSPPTDASKEHNCIPDEHYVQTLLNQKGLEKEITRRSLTYSSWDFSSSRDPQRRGWHPVTYRLADATQNLIQSIKAIDNIYYETEYRREWCNSKGKPLKCFLFGRKFTRPAALRLLNMICWSVLVVGGPLNGQWVDCERQLQLVNSRATCPLLRNRGSKIMGSSAVVGDCVSTAQDTAGKGATAHRRWVFCLVVGPASNEMLTRF
ncbi:Core-2/I-branching beta-1,6-N-acetylglucosaminyltransferase family protein [Striga asiatica]|uniref:Core-2/I-branching beta-1,6-N-acetylglucosaminyltransferase family protein n=1 Tax=Striga asiatica TaxID=4170 RepID=A0A5A7QSS0_STRAF|nr:Core-2/I-branching beta-1,6-N-acetylglucosaminyltransferase family protein [Striga asiatica]